MLLYIFIAMVLLLLNEYRLIKKYIAVINSSEGQLKKSTLHKIALVALKPIISIKRWIDYKLLNDELHYH